ncbi:type II toxin-antitoxin system RelE family toxin [Desulfitobacterium sp.]|uniref:type II toxin-antitoxin system RelE family toxin n=1 Tax=Desulfitobacterium sp. TaxID=49981 RepID=UPI002B1F696E|nr:type II toxin-antitoxin system RelE/ParE family toxin [Desulfitobacterium sp.]MEA4900328.1 type II toxin-antitoxin system RelE/ParE family toxin [Desulfitobacterium sp.]
MYQVIVTKSADKDIAKLHPTVRQAVESALPGLKNWQGNIIKLTDTRNEYRLRIGRYRVLFELKNGTIYVYGVDDRKEAYKHRR